MKEKVKKTLLFSATIVPLIVLAATFAMWIDTRYMHKQISDTRFIEVQMMILEMRVEDYEEKIDNDIIDLTSEEERKYQIYKSQLQNLVEQRNRLLGIGE